MSLKIIGTGSALPERIVTNDELAGFLDTSDEWITTRTGIHSRRVCTGETMCGLASRAAESALEAADMRPEELDLLICSTIAGDCVTPSLACMVQEQIGACCPAFDLNGACTGFLYALDAAAAYIESGRAARILIVAAEMMSKHVDWNDRRTCVLFGDGAGACVVTEGGALRYLRVAARGDAQTIRLERICGNSPYLSPRETDGFMHMNGPAVFKFAVTQVERSMAEVRTALGITPDDVDLYLLHQANRRIIDSAREHLRQPAEKFPLIIGETGNISSASIPVLLDGLLRGGRVRTGDTLFLSAFGAGMTTGTGILVWE